MEIRVDFSSLVSSVERIGGTIRDMPLGEFVLDDISPISIELEHGIDVELKDVEINKGGLLGYKGHQVVLYIPDQGWRIDDVFEDGSKGKKVHVANCKTLDDMKAKGRFERYVVRNGLSPEFAVTGKTREGVHEEGSAHLRVCMNCIRYLNYQDSNNRSRGDRWNIVENFSLDQFFAGYSSYFKFMPRRSAEEVSIETYTADWRQVSNQYRVQVEWACEVCSVVLSEAEHRKLLHVHHKNGVKNDNSIQNLMALCVDCHSKMPMHQHLFVTKSDRRVIQKLRMRQKAYRIPQVNSHDSNDWRAALLVADPAVHGLMYELKAQQYPVPEVGVDILHPETRRIVYSNAELAWPSISEVVVLEMTDECSDLEELGWQIFTAQGLLDWLNEQPK